MKYNTRSGRIIREETRKERLTRPSNLVISTIRRPHTEVYGEGTTYRWLLQAPPPAVFFGRTKPLFKGKAVAHSAAFVLSDALMHLI
jgi:hypothetical protein